MSTCGGNILELFVKCLDISGGMDIEKYYMNFYVLSVFVRAENTYVE